MNKLSIQDILLKDKKVLMRVDFNVPLNEDQTIADDTRIKAALTSIQYVLNQGGKLILMSHLGRPKGKKNEKLSLKPVVERLSAYLKVPIFFAPDCVGNVTEKMAEELKPKEVLLLENLRFHEEEENPEKNPDFTKNLASLGEIYIDDAFGTAHRKHASTFFVPKLFPNRAASGFLMEKEVAFLGGVIKHPKRPFYAIIGGVKVSTKVGVISNLVEKVDGLFIGGGMAYTFLKAAGGHIGDSIVEEGYLNTAREIQKNCQEKAVQFWLPSDFVIADSFQNEAQSKIVTIKESIPDGWQGMDIGPKTCIEWKEYLKNAQTIFWNGPLGVFEMPNFSKGTTEIAFALAESSATTIIGGGDSIHAINDLNLSEKFTHISTGGGASMEYIEYGHLPGIDALSDR